jgi:hypothetical protein
VAAHRTFRASDVRPVVRIVRDEMAAAQEAAVVSVVDIVEHVLAPHLVDLAGRREKPGVPVLRGDLDMQKLAVRSQHAAGIGFLPFHCAHAPLDERGRALLRHWVGVQVDHPPRLRNGEDLHAIWKLDEAARFVVVVVVKTAVVPR